MPIGLGNNLLQLSFVIVHWDFFFFYTLWTILCDSHSHFIVPLIPHNPSHLPHNPVSPPLSHSVIERLRPISHPTTTSSDLFFFLLCYPLSRSLHLPPSARFFSDCPLFRETAGQTNGERYPLANRKIGQKGGRETVEEERKIHGLIGGQS